MKFLLNRKIGIFLVLFSLVFTIVGGTAAQAADFSNKVISGVTDISNQGTPPDITALSAILIDADTGQILYAKNENEKHYPASTTKVMTALLAIENLKMDAILTVDSEAAATTGSKMHVSEGENIAVADLLYAIMLESANDAAVVLAKGVSGTVTEFVALMNKRAKTAGAINSHFTNANGLPDDQHMTTAYDLAMITKAAFDYPIFRKVIATVNYSMEATNMYEKRYFINGNRMLWDTELKLDIDGVKTMPKYEGTTGVKTGFTNAAKSCLIASADREGHELIGVVLGSSEDKHYVDMIKLFNYGYATYDQVTVCAAEDVRQEVKIKGGMEKKLSVGVSDDFKISLPVGAKLGTVKTNLNLEKKYEAPIEKGKDLGTIEIYYNDVLLCSSELTALDTVVAKKKMDVSAIVLKILKIAAIIVAILAIIVVLAVVLINRLYEQKKQRKKQINRKDDTMNDEFQRKKK